MYMMDEVCQLLKKWEQTYPSLRISINVSRMYIFRPGFARRVLEIVERNGVSTKQLEIEITESVIFDRSLELFAIIQELRSYGFRISMDDFGSGYSSLNMLKDIPVDVLKLDMRFFSEETNMDKGGISLRQSSIWRICWESWWWLKAWKQSGRRISCCRFSAASYRDICTAVPCRWMHLKRFWRSVLWEIR